MIQQSSLRERRPSNPAFGHHACFDWVAPWENPIRQEFRVCMAKLVVITKSLAGLALELGKSWVTIGRAAGNTFQIVETSISGQHCEVLLRGDELIVRDMRSTNGTFIKGVLVTEGILKKGEILRLGEIDLQLEDSIAPVQNVKTPMMPQAVLNSPHPLVQAEMRLPRQNKVLLVDDSMAFLETVGETFEMLSAGSWEIHKASAADQALSILQQHRIELVVLDISMPMLDGVQLLGVIHRRHSEVKKVVLTGNATDTHRATCLAGGAELFLEKPITPAGFATVFNLLNDLFVWSQREGFSGTLRQVGLTDVIQIECLRRNSCILEVHNSEKHGAIYIESGEIVHAIGAGLEGEQALYRLLSMQNGEFRLQPFKNSARRTIHCSWENLLMEAARFQDEEKVARASEDTVFMSKTALKTNSTDQPQPPSTPVSIPDMKELGEDIVVVSTYDGEWHPTSGPKK
ncbi:MAG: response regulator [Verrucomicrobiales bacterium]|nr:MAG: response regulator [Verrucomicrobiales bacterium]